MLCVDFLSRDSNAIMSPEAKYQKLAVALQTSVQSLVMNDPSSEISPVLSKLVLPYYKLKSSLPGFDILSFDENGTPLCIEVKTSEQEDDIGFHLTKNEHDAARKLIDKGYTYLFYHLSYWDTPTQKLDIYDFKQMVSENRITAEKYMCNVRPKPISVIGIVHYRKMMGLLQNELAKMTNIPATSLCKYEQGQNVSVKVCANSHNSLTFRLTIY